MRATGTALLAGLLMTQPALAAQCFTGSASAISLKSWSLEVVSQTTRRLNLTLVSHLEKPVSMLSVQAGFYSSAGEHIGGYALSNNFRIMPGEVKEVSAEFGSGVMPQLETFAPDEVDPYFCTVSVVFEDGSQLQF